jgi:hypothetical protein
LFDRTLGALNLDEQRVPASGGVGLAAPDKAA